MQIKNNFHVFRYTIFSLINICFLIYFFGLHQLANIFSFYICLILNQYFLIIGLADLLEISKNSVFPSWLSLMLKLLILIFAFWWGMKKLPGSIVFLIGSYIFQLIILVISTKRIVKKN